MHTPLLETTLAEQDIVPGVAMCIVISEPVHLIDYRLPILAVYHTEQVIRPMWQYPGTAITQIHCF